MTASSDIRRAKTRVEEVYTIIRQDILRGVLVPSQKLSPSILAQDYGVSASVVREALTRLTEQGLVVSQPQLGFAVTPISRDDLLDLTSTRLDVETLVLRRSVDNGDVDWRAELAAAHYRLEHTPQFDNEVDPPVLREDWAAAHKVFHDALLSACGSARLLGIAESLRDSAELYRRWSAPIGGAYKRDIAQEHREIFEAAQAGDAERAAEHLAFHISHTTKVLLKHAT